MIHSLVVGQFSKMLGNLVEILNEADKYAGEKKFDAAVLLHARLAPDQFDLMQQVRIACDTAKLGAARLAGTEKDAPVHADTEATLAEIKARIESTVAYLKSFTAQSVRRGCRAADHPAALERQVALGRGIPRPARNPELLFPRHDDLRDPAPQRRPGRQEELSGRDALPRSGVTIGRATLSCSSPPIGERNMRA